MRGAKFSFPCPGTFHRLRWRGIDTTGHQLRRRGRAGIIVAARQATMSGARVVVTGVRIRNVNEIRQLAPKFKGDVDPNTVETRSIRRRGRQCQLGAVAECIHSELPR